jgi:uncharacterized membrane protein YeiH
MLYIIFLIALAAQSMTAALAAGRRKMDWLGVCLLACVTALGGGSMRDTLLGHYPLSWVEDPFLLFWVIGAALVTIAFARFMAALHWPFLILDAVGLVVFTVIGCSIALEMGHPPVIVIVAGMITGVAGGVMRDVLCNDVPLLFSSELYATVSIVTGIAYLVGIELGLPHELMAILALLVGLPLRMLAIAYKIGMPKFIYDEDMR